MQKLKNNLPTILWIALGVLALGLVAAAVMYPEPWLTSVLSVALALVLGVQVYLNRKARATAYGLRSATTVLLVLAIVGVVNFFGYRYPQKLDLTKNKLHTLSDQTEKVVKGLKNPVKATLFGKTQQREQARPLLDNYRSLNPKFEVEYVDPDKEVTRAKAAGIKKYGTLQLTTGERESKIEDPTEEKLTNALIKLLKEKSQHLCSISGHEERSMDAATADGYSTIKKGLTDQSYEVSTINLMQENKIPEKCDAIALLGPAKALFPQEVKLISGYLANGGRAVVALDSNLKGTEPTPELVSALEAWFVKAQPSIIVDPSMRMFNADASLPIIPTFEKAHPITRDQTEAIFPLPRPLEVLPNPPAGMTVQWLARTTPGAFAVLDPKGLAKGQLAVTTENSKQGPHTVAVAVEGKLKDSKAPRNTRVVFFGTSQFANNNYARFAGNADFFLNAVSWVLEDESMISIRGKEEGPGKIELSKRQGDFIFLLTVIIIPALVAIGGIAFWVIRRRW